MTKFKLYEKKTSIAICIQTHWFYDYFVQKIANKSIINTHTTHENTKVKFKKSIN